MFGTEGENPKINPPVIKELHGTRPFPVAAAPVKGLEEPGSEKPYYSAIPMSIGTGPDARFVFGMNKEATATILRALAADIEAGRVILQQGAVTSKVRNDEFAMTWLTVKFSETIR